MSYDMYQEQILDHYKNPRNRGKLEDAEIKARDDNPLCGDEIELYLKLDGNGSVKDVRFDGHGCAISQASASMLTQMIKGKSLEDVKRIDKDRILRALGISLSPIRLKCALLSIQVLHTGLNSYSGG